MTRLWTILLCLSGVHNACSQRQLLICAAEHNVFFSKSLWSPDAPKTYRTVLRPLFIQQGRDWVEAPDTLLPKIMLLKAVGSKGQYAAVRMRITEHQIAGAGYYQFATKAPALKPFPKNIVTEENDILSYRVLSSSGVSPGKVLLKTTLNAATKVAVTDTIQRLFYSYITKTTGIPRPDSLRPGTAFPDYVSSIHSIIQQAVDHATGFVTASDFKIITVPLSALPGNVFGQIFSINGFREDGSPPRLMYIIHPDGEVQPLYADMNLLEHADFNGDGREEFLFFYSQFNHYGYLLLYDDFKKQVRNGWSYH